MSNTSPRTLAGGQWVVRGATKRWVRGEPLARPRRRLRMAVAKQWGEASVLGRHGHLFDDSPGVTAARLADMVADHALFDGGYRAIYKGKEAS